MHVIVPILDSLEGWIEIRPGSGGQEGIYTDFGGTLTEVVDLTANLEAGETVASLSLSPTGFNGGTVTFQATFADGTQGIYSADMPEPTTVGVMALASLGLLRRRPRRSADETR